MLSRSRVSWDHWLELRALSRQCGLAQRCASSQISALRSACRWHDMLATGGAGGDPEHTVQYIVASQSATRKVLLYQTSSFAQVSSASRPWPSTCSALRRASRRCSRAWIACHHVCIAALYRLSSVALCVALALSRQAASALHTVQYVAQQRRRSPSIL